MKIYGIVLFEDCGIKESKSWTVIGTNSSLWTKIANKRRAFLFFDSFIS